MDYLYTL